MVTSVPTEKPRVVAYVSKQIHKELTTRAAEEDESISRFASNILSNAFNPDHALVRFSPTTMQKLKKLAAAKGLRNVEDLIQLYCLKGIESEK